MRTKDLAILMILMYFLQGCGQNDHLAKQAKEAMFIATRFMVEEISTEGGYLWYYLPDLSRRWGEMEAYPSMIWLQDPGTVSMGHIFLDAYHTTGDEYYYQAAEMAANAIIRGQMQEGGWNYMVDFAGEESIREWYNTIGRHGWRLEEFHDYHGNSTFDDKVTSDAARFLLRIYLERREPKYKIALEKVISFILKSQYSNGGWPQRFPPMDALTDAEADYTAYYTFNDDVIWENIHFLVQCYQNLTGSDYTDAINRGMDFFLLSQHASAGWAQQYTMEMKPAEARTYEPVALLPSTTYKNALLLLRFYDLSGKAKYLEPIPKAIEWLELTALPPPSTGGGRFTHPTFVQPGTNKALYVHRKGSNVIHGFYYVDDRDTLLLGHYSGKTKIDLAGLKTKYKAELDKGGRDAHRDQLKDNVTYFELNRSRSISTHETDKIEQIIRELDEQGRWLSAHAMISNPYIGEGMKEELTDQYATSHVGDSTDTSPFRDTTEQMYISTRTYLNNMRMIIDWLQTP